MEKISASKMRYDAFKKSFTSFWFFTLIDVILLCVVSFALFSPQIGISSYKKEFAGSLSVEASPEGDKRCVISFSADGNSKNVFVTVATKDFEFRTENFPTGEEFSFELCGYSSDEITLALHNGVLTKSENESLIENGKAYAVIGGKLTKLSVYKVYPGNTVEFIASRHNRSVPAYETSAAAIKAYNYIFDETDFDSYYDEVIIPPSDFTSDIDTLPIAEDIPLDETENP